jgi:hypothetical protein
MHFPESNLPGESCEMPELPPQLRSPSASFVTANLGLETVVRVVHMTATYKSRPKGFTLDWIIITLDAVRIEY